ncbi:phage repressor protein/antirepressor Ant [Lactococcus petauri]|uniref:phage antirepressor KilAC domain-containing protein n=1 Tax=Lactococcus petauri TaxID=1940789 RepID=UPI0013FDEF5B|nr:phage antirepressor KilAC domain-containing protein [Lactococcus petauri]NHI75220.1 phage repressor protein/antirepressor Ant [Lactococcus petauri]
MNQLQNFNFNNLQVRTVLIENEPWFVAKDVADILEYSETAQMTRRLDSEDSMSVKLTGMNMKSTIINESGLYEAIIGSKKKDARKFKRWITHEVLPTIRKHGSYMTDAKAQDVLTGNGLADMLSQAAEQLRAKELVISEMKPKALFADSVAASNQSILIGELAKYLKQNGVDIGANRLFAWLRENGWLINRKGEQWNQPTQKGLNRGLFEIKKRVLNNPDGTVFTTSTTKVTGKGQIYFVNKFLQNDLAS